MIHSVRLYSSALTDNLGLVAKGFEKGDLKRERETLIQETLGAELLLLSHEEQDEALGGLLDSPK